MRTRTAFEIVRFGIRYVRERLNGVMKRICHKFYSNYEKMDMDEACNIVNSYISDNWDSFVLSIKSEV